MDDFTKATNYLRYYGMLPDGGCPRKMLLFFQKLAEAEEDIENQIDDFNREMLDSEFQLDFEPHFGSWDTEMAYHAHDLLASLDTTG
jgi:hypothetical protein